MVVRVMHRQSCLCFLNLKHRCASDDDEIRRKAALAAVSYTHLTLPTN